MNTSTSGQHRDNLDGALRSAVEQISSAPPPGDVADRVLARAAKWDEVTSNAPSKKPRRYLVPGLALAVVVLVAITIALVSGLPHGRPVAAPPLDEKTMLKTNELAELGATPKENPASAVAGIEPATRQDANDGGTPNDMRSGIQAGSFAAGGAMPSKRAGASPATQEQQATKTDQERMIGNWFIINDDSLRKGEMWVINDDNILMYAKHTGINTQEYFHRLDATQDTKHIDITVKRVKGPTIGVIKGLYVLEGDELRLCLAPLGKDRPAAFPQKPAQGEVLILRRATASPAPPETQEQQPAPKQEPNVLTPAEAIQQNAQEPITVQFKVAAVETIIAGGAISQDAKVSRLWVRLKDGGNFSAQLRGRVTYQLERLGIDPARHFNDKTVRVTGQLQHVESAGTYQIVVNELDHVEVNRQ